MDIDETEIKTYRYFLQTLLNYNAQWCHSRSGNGLHVLLPLRYAYLQDPNRTLWVMRKGWITWKGCETPHRGSICPLLGLS